MLLGGWRKVYTPGAAWRSAGHLTTYGPTDNPTFVITFSPFQIDRKDTNESRTSYPIYCNCSITRSDTDSIGLTKIKGPNISQGTTAIPWPREFLLIIYLRLF